VATSREAMTAASRSVTSDSRRLLTIGTFFFEKRFDRSILPSKRKINKGTKNCVKFKKSKNINGVSSSKKPNNEVNKMPRIFNGKTDTSKKSKYVQGEHLCK
jgi:hypothetical protein